MKKILIVLLFGQLLYGDKISVELIDVKDSFGQFESNSDIKVGMTGVVERVFKYGYSSIIAYAEVIESGKVKLSEFDLLNQESLSKGLWKPKTGDRISFRLDYNRALIIAPNRENYLAIESSITQDSIHPDIFSATLNSNGQVRPLKEDFRYICQQHHIGVVYLNYDNKVDVLDCLSGVKIDSLNIQLKNRDGDVQKPFFSRIKKLKADLFGSGTDEFKDYDRYYRELF